MNAVLKSRSDEVAIDRIDLDIKNDRHEVDQVKLRELAESIRVQGLVQPVLVFEKEKDRFVLACGHRRLAAHKLLKLTTIRAEIRPHAPVADILAARAIENLQREDLSPLEEAEACEALIDKHEGAAQAAAAIGWPLRRFENRLALARLSPRVRQLLENGQIYLAHAQEIAQIPDFKKQEEIAGEIKGEARRYNERTVIDTPPGSVSRCKQLVKNYQRDVSKVVWRTDVPFGGKPACDTCPMRTGNCKGLFAHQEDDDPNICLDAECFKEKSTLAGRAVNKVAFTIAKEGLPKSEEGVRQAIEIRGPEQKVEYVKPAAAIKASKEISIGGHGAKPSSKRSGTPTDDEEVGEKNRAVDEAARKLYRQAFQIWAEKRDKMIGEFFAQNPLRLVAFSVLRSHEDFNSIYLERAKPVSSKKMRELLQIVKTPTLDGLVKLQKEVVASLIPRRQDNGRYVEGQWLKWKQPVETAALSSDRHVDDDEVFPALIVAFGIELQREPELKDFRSQASTKAKNDKRAQEGDKAKAAKKQAQAKKTAPKKKKK